MNGGQQDRAMAAEVRFDTGAEALPRTTRDCDAFRRTREAGEDGTARYLFRQFRRACGRIGMKYVTKEELAAMDTDSDRYALELSDADDDPTGYACLVAIISMGCGICLHACRCSASFITVSITIRCDAISHVRSPVLQAPFLSPSCTFVKPAVRSRRPRKECS